MAEPPFVSIEQDAKNARVYWYQLQTCKAQKELLLDAANCVFDAFGDEVWMGERGEALDNLQEAVFQGWRAP